MNGTALIAAMARQERDPRRWPRRVADRLRAIFELVRRRMSLTPQDCAFVAGQFIYPNLVHWMWGMADSSASRSFQGECPVYGGHPDCRLGSFFSPDGLSELRRQDVCRRGSEAHPWSLHVTLLFNAAPAWISSRSGASLPSRAKPSRDCARDVWLRIVEQPAVGKRWLRVNVDTALSERRRLTLPVWEQIAEGISDAAGRLFEKGTDVSAAADVSSLRSGPIARFCLLTNQQLIDRWIREQSRPLPRPLADIQGVLVGILRPVRRYAGNTMPLDRYRAQVDEFVRLVRQLDVPGADAVLAYLERESLDRNGQIVLQQFIARNVVPRLSLDLPEGDPLDDPVVQDLFWHRVGSSPEPAGRPFEAGRWADRRWTPRGAMPEWRFRS